jgi:hypothetical protein
MGLDVFEGPGKASLKKIPFYLSFEGWVELLKGKGVVTCGEELSCQREALVTRFWGGVQRIQGISGV